MNIKDSLEMLISLQREHNSGRTKDSYVKFWELDLILRVGEDSADGKDIPVSERTCGCLVKDSKSHCPVHNKTDKIEAFCKTETFQKGIIYFAHAPGCKGMSYRLGDEIKCEKCKRTISI